MPDNTHWPLDLPKPGDPEVERRFVQLGEDRLERESWYGAGHAFDEAVICAWGATDRMLTHTQHAISAYQRAIELCSRCQPEAWLAMDALSRVGQGAFRLPATTVDALLQELAARIQACVSGDPAADVFMIRGVIVETDFEKRFELIAPEFDGHSGHRRGNQLHLTSPFRSCVLRSDYVGAVSLAQAWPAAFTTPFLKGWRIAAAGFLNSETAPEQFAEAADIFASDVPPEPGSFPPEGVWTAENFGLWANYFRARSLVARAIRDPKSVRELIPEAASTFPPNRSGFQNATATRWAVLIDTLAHLLQSDDPDEIVTTRRGFAKELSLLGTVPSDDLLDRFLVLSAQSLQGFREDPEQEIVQGTLRDALALLDRMPVAGADLARVVGREIGRNVLRITQGPVVTWMHRALERIEDERDLQRVLLRLFQASSPSYAQVVHGPIEYGKDLIVIADDGDGLLGRLIQVKVGDLSLTKWRVARIEMQELFEVDLGRLPPGAPTPTRYEGILLCTGHAAPMAAPAIDAWMSQQRSVFGRHVEFWHLDRVVEWIQKERLFNELRLALAEVGVDSAF